MARRRKLEAPDPADLAAFEERFRGETETTPSAPIGRLAADSAASADLRDPGDRADAARMAARAEALDAAEARGLVLAELPLDQIFDGTLIRDRIALDEGEMSELIDSIARHGLRLPIEVHPLPEVAGRHRYGLLSGYRRLMAVRRLHARTGTHGTIKAIVRDPAGLGGAFVAMVEENEVRSDLSHFERGRIAVIAAGQGAFASTEAAVDALFASASKAKRSKVRSFALIFEVLGDLLAFPEAMTEKQGLRIAAALRSGAEPRLRAALEPVRAEGFQDEWAAIEPVLVATEAEGRPATTRGGRPRGTRPPRHGASVEALSSGIAVSQSRDGQGWVIRLSGPGLDQEIVDSLMAEIRHLLDRP